MQCLTNYFRDLSKNLYQQGFAPLANIDPDKSREDRFQLPPEVRIAPHGESAKMLPVPDTIEAEVLEIDGSPPPPPNVQEPKFSSRSRAPWESLRGKVVRLDRRWWPLWVILGGIALALALTVGVVIAAIVIVAKVIGGILRFLFGDVSNSSGTGLSRRPF